MINNFTTEATAKVFSNLANDPKTYELVEKLVKSAPATAPQEIKTFVEQRLPKPNDELAAGLQDAALRDVRWNEIRTAIQRMQ